MRSGTEFEVSKTRIFVPEKIFNSGEIGQIRERKDRKRVDIGRLLFL